MYVILVDFVTHQPLFSNGKLHTLPDTSLNVILYDKQEE